MMCKLLFKVSVLEVVIFRYSYAVNIVIESSRVKNVKSSTTDVCELRVANMINTTNIF